MAAKGKDFSLCYLFGRSDNDFAELVCSSRRQSTAVRGFLWHHVRAVSTGGCEYKGAAAVQMCGTAIGAPASTSTAFTIWSGDGKRGQT